MNDRFIEDTYLLLKTPRNTPHIDSNQVQSAVEEEVETKKPEDENETGNEERSKVTNKGELHVDFKEAIVHEINMNDEEKNDDDDGEEA
jgi:hypothetical protein